jgi:long-subunit fatty acid transport protein
MKAISLTISLLGLTAGAAGAAGIERTQQSVALLFEPGRALQFSLGSFSPTLTGTVGGGALSSGDMAPGYTTLTFGYKMALGDRMDLAVIYDQSLGADVDYTGADIGYPFRGVEATLDESDLTAILRYKFDGGFSVYGGLRWQAINAELSGLPVPTVPAIYALEVDRSTALGWLAGVAYERPDIALRVALTYNSAIDHDFDATETFNGTVVPAGGFTTTIPKSVNLEFQSGVAADTLVFGSIRWQEWSVFDITPAALGVPLIDYESDYFTYTLGVGRKFTEAWSGALTVAYEPASGDIQGNLAPRDGYVSVGLSATYRVEQTEITAGVRYYELGDATTQTIGAEFENNDSVALGVRVTQRF